MEQVDGVIDAKLMLTIIILRHILIWEQIIHSNDRNPKTF